MPNKITFILPGRGLSGGVRVVAAHGNYLATRGHSVTIICLKQRLPLRPGALLRRMYKDLAVTTGLHRDHLHEFKGRLIAVSPDDVASRIGCGDVVIATHWSTAALVAALPRSAGRKAYFVQHYEAHSFDRAAVDATWRLPLRKIVVATWLRDLAAECFNDPTAIHAPNGVDTTQFDAVPRSVGHPPSVGLMYSTAPWKGAKDAFQAVSLARKMEPDLEVICFGAMKPQRSLPLPNGTRFHYQPRQDRLRDIYAAADIWLCPSETEGFSLPPLEAMACRCPVVATRCGGPEDFVQDGKNGFLVPVGDVEAMAERIVTLVTNGPLWRRMSDEAYMTRERFSLARSSSAFEQAILEVAGGGQTSTDARTVDSGYGEGEVRTA